MDTSEDYINMCVAAHVLDWRPRVGDFYYEPNGRNSPEYCVSVWLPGDIAAGKTWLPRIDQLQHIVDVDNMHGMVYVVLRIENMPSTSYWLGMTSLEQWWLAYVMMDKYNGAHWDGVCWKSNI